MVIVQKWNTTRSLSTRFEQDIAKLWAKITCRSGGSWILLVFWKRFVKMRQLYILLIKAFTTSHLCSNYNLLLPFCPTYSLHETQETLLKRWDENFQRNISQAFLLSSDLLAALYLNIQKLILWIFEEENIFIYTHYYRHNASFDPCPSAIIISSGLGIFSKYFSHDQPWRQGGWTLLLEYCICHTVTQLFRRELSENWNIANNRATSQ